MEWKKSQSLSPTRPELLTAMIGRTPPEKRNNLWYRDNVGRKKRPQPETIFSRDIRIRA
jgi:hypothetical protein